MPSKKTTPVKKRAAGKKRGGLTSALGPKATTILVICVMAGGIAIAARQKEQTKAKAAVTEAVFTADAGEAPATPARKAAKTPATPDAIAAANVAATSGSTPMAKPDTTITGCLERSGEGFRLKNTAGEDAPKSRSWKSGFLKKGSASIDVVDPSRTLRLSSRVGHRVSVSGTLVNRELRADSVHQVAPSCKAD